MKVKTIAIVGGGTAGWMSAATLSKLFPDKTIYVIESPDIAPIGVGESTIKAFNHWLEMLDIEDTDFMKATDATYKLNITLKDFYEKDTEAFSYPFTFPYETGLPRGKNLWFLKKQTRPGLSRSDYARWLSPITIFSEQGKVPSYNDRRIPGFNFKYDIAYHFDAHKLGVWLRDKFIKPNKVKHILEEITSIETDENGIKTLNKKYTADLFLDCSGFNSILMNKIKSEKNRSASKILINDRAWVARVPHKNKEERSTTTLCTAIQNGWVWEIPTWDRMGVGYVHSTKFTDPDTALAEFQHHLKDNGYQYKGIDYKYIKFDTYRYERMFDKNVCAIGLSACFIEPLESTGLLFIHDNLLALARCLQRHDHITQLDRDTFNTYGNKVYDGYVDFLAYHFYATSRTDTEYWRYFYNTSLLDLSYNKDEGIRANMLARLEENWFNPGFGFHYIAAGMNYDPLDLISRDLVEDNIMDAIKTRDEWVDSVRDTVKKEETHYNFLKKHIYHD